MYVNLDKDYGFNLQLSTILSKLLCMYKVFVMVNLFDPVVLNDDEYNVF
jgi:hypothetical protein